MHTVDVSEMKLRADIMSIISQFAHSLCSMSTRLIQIDNKFVHSELRSIHLKPCYHSLEVVQHCRQYSNDKVIQVIYIINCLNKGKIVFKKPFHYTLGYRLQHV